MAEEKQGKNIALLLFLSDYKSNSRKEDYYYDGNKKPVTGMQTNDAPVKYLLEMALEKLELGKKLYILCITSYKVMKDSNEYELNDHEEYQNLTMWQYFTTRIVNDEQCEAIPIPYDYKEGETGFTKLSEEDEDTNQMAQRIFGEISDKLEENHISDVYVDYTGGLRDINFLMTTITRYLEFMGINCQKVVYSQFQNKKIYDITYIYEMFQMINGVNEFVTTGNATALNEVFKSEEHDKAVKNLLANIVDFANAMSICDVSNIGKKLESVEISIDTVMKSPDSNVKTAMLKKLLPLMKEKMYLKDTNANSENGKINYLNLINWCADNNMLQQALTLIEDKMIEILIDEKGSDSCDNKVLLYKFYDTDENKEKYLRKVGPGYETNEKRKIFYYTTRDYNTTWELSDSNLANLQIMEKGEVEKIIEDWQGEKDDQNAENTDSGEHIMETRAKECQVQDEESFIEAYCRFRRLEDISSREDGEQYKSDYGSILKWCEESNTRGTFEVQNKKGTTLASAKLQIELHDKIKNNLNLQKDLENTLLLHSALKKERNCCNHASESGVRLSVGAVKRAIKIYARRVEKVLKFIDGSEV